MTANILSAAASVLAPREGSLELGSGPATGKLGLPVRKAEAMAAGVRKC